MKKRANIVQSDRYKLLVSSIRDYAIYMLDAEGIISSWNAGAQRFKGYTPDEAIGRHFSCFYTPEEQQLGVPDRALKIALDEGAYEAEGWRVRKDGTRFWAHVVIDPLRDNEGALIGYAKITRDITEKKQAQEALRESEQRFSILVQGVTDYAIYMLSPEGMVTNWNAGAMRIKGYTADEVIGTHFSRFLTPEDQAKLLPEQSLAIAAHEGRFEKEGWRVRKDGTRFWAHVIIDAIKNDMGDLVGFAKITRDITQKMMASKELEIASAALAQSRKVESLGNLTGGVAHDFNNLLSVIAAGLDVLSMQDNHSKDKPLLDNMQRAVSRGATLIQQLLSYARQQPLKPEIHNINSLINGFELMLRKVGNSKLECNITLAPDLKCVKMDENSFEISLLNLLVNASDAMPEGGLVNITTQNIMLEKNEVTQLPAGEYVLLAVEDNGVGMSPEVLEKACEPFFTTKEFGKGTGLGLSQVYGFIKQSGGEIVIMSVPKQGTSVKIYLPTITNVLESDIGPENRSLKGTDMNTINDTVLIVEDESEVRFAAAELFKSLGFDVLMASNGIEAINIIEKEGDRINVLFSDVVMPNGLSGIDLSRSVSKIYPKIKIVLCSGYPQPALKGEDEDLSAFVFLNKPYRVADLARSIRATH